MVFARVADDMKPVYLWSTLLKARQVLWLRSAFHTSSNDVPPTYTLMRVEGPDVECRSILLESLPPEWPRSRRSLASWETNGFERKLLSC